MDNILSSAILCPVPGTAPGDRSAVSRTLVALGRTGLKNEQIEVSTLTRSGYRKTTPVAVDTVVLITQ